jgi:hypothetical protein
MTRKATKESTMSNEFKSKKAFLWLAAVAVLMVSLIGGLMLLPAASPTKGTDGPDVRVPAMQNVPPEGAPKMRLETEARPETEQKE